MGDNDVYEKMERALVIADKLLPLLPDYNVFHFSYYAKEKLGWNNEDVQEITIHSPYIKRLMIEQLKYVNEVTPGQLFELTDKGREAKTAGGHNAYLAKLSKEKKRLERKESYDFLMKKFIYRYRALPYVLSAMGFIISIGTAVWVQKSKQNILPNNFEKQMPPMFNKKEIRKDSIIENSVPKK